MYSLGMFFELVLYALTHTYTRSSHPPPPIFRTYVWCRKQLLLLFPLWSVADGEKPRESHANPLIISHILLKVIAMVHWHPCAVNVLYTSIFRACDFSHTHFKLIHNLSRYPSAAHLYTYTITRFSTVCGFVVRHIASCRAADRIIKREARVKLWYSIINEINCASRKYLSIWI